MAIRGGSIQLIACTSGIYLESENEVVRVQRIKKTCHGEEVMQCGVLPAVGTNGTLPAQWRG